MTCPSTLPLPQIQRATHIYPRILKYATSLIIALIGASIFSIGYPWRQIEAHIAGYIFTPFVPGGIYTFSDTVYFLQRGEGNNSTVGIQITSECSSFIIVAILLILIATTIAFTRTSLKRGVTAAIIGPALIYGVNILRLGVIFLSTNIWGIDTGFEISHVFVGTAVALIGFIASLILTGFILFRNTAKPTDEQTDDAATSPDHTS